jgi:hypothetical protein
MNSAPLFDTIVAALNAVSVTLLLCGALLVLGCQFLGVAGRRGTRGRSHEA